MRLEHINLTVTDLARAVAFYSRVLGAKVRWEGTTSGGMPAAHVGTDDWYLSEQIRAFRAGERGAHPDDRTGKQMRAMAMVLPNEQAIADVVAFIRSLEN